MNCKLSYDDNKALRQAGGPELGVCDITVAIAEVMGIYVDDVFHETFNSGTSGTDWRVIGVADEDNDKLEKAIEICVALAKQDVDWDVILKMLSVYAIH